MSDPETRLPIDERIRSHYAGLSPQEQQAADFILDHLTDLATYSATELASASEVSKATVSRLFRRLGFAGANEVRDQARALRNPGAPILLEGTPGGAADHFAAEARAFRTLEDVLDDVTVDLTVSLIGAARSVVVIGFRNGYPLALHLRQQLVQARERVRLAPLSGQTIGEDLAGLDARDLVVLFGFRRRPAGFARLLSVLSDLAVPVVLIADSSARNYSDQVRVRLECPLGGTGVFDSYAASVSLINLIASRVVAQRPGRGRRRIAEITDLYEMLHEIEPPAGTRRAR